MNKYIQDELRNKSRSIMKDMTKPQKKAFSEMLRGLFVGGEPILRRMAQHPTNTVKKQAEKYSHHLGNIDIKTSVDEAAIRKVRPEIQKNTIIAYDLTDIEKEYAEKMEHISRVFDGSRRKTCNGFTVHGVGVNNILLNFEVHRGDLYTQNQIRRKILSNLAEEFEKKGIYVFDRGNDDKAFFNFLRHKLKVQFIARLKSNRLVVMKETGAIMKVRNIPPGKYEVYLMNYRNTGVDTRAVFTLVVEAHLMGKQPIRLLAYLKEDFSSEQIVEMYMQRWGVENMYRRAKQKFKLENIRVLNHQKFVNLVSLIQFAVNVSTMAFFAMQKLTHALISGVYFCYQKFIKQKSLNSNIDSFISFLKSSLKPLIFHKPNPPPEQLKLLSRRSLEKLGSF
jgi:hypothetical protein